MGGLQTRFVTAIALTPVDLLIIDYEIFVASSRDKNSNQMSVDERYRFLHQVPLLKHWEAFQLFRLSHALIQVEVDKGCVVIRKGEANSKFYFSVN